MAAFLNWANYAPVAYGSRGFFMSWAVSVFRQRTRCNKVARILRPPQPQKRTPSGLRTWGCVKFVASLGFWWGGRGVGMGGRPAGLLGMVTPDAPTGFMPQAADHVDLADVLEEVRLADLDARRRCANASDGRLPSKVVGNLM